MFGTRLVKWALLATLLSSGNVMARDLTKPTGKVVLVVRGDIGVTNNGDSAEFDFDMLKTLGMQHYKLETPWVEGMNIFSGPLLRAVLNAVEAKGETLNFKALNDYVVSVPRSDARHIDTILAIELNDQPISVREKGPVFLIYPFHKDKSLYTERYFARSIWQIKELVVAP
jgi:hypothetical protein